jgi:hypothetical protein
MYPARILCDPMQPLQHAGFPVYPLKRHTHSNRSDSERIGHAAIIVDLASHDRDRRLSSARADSS